LPDRRVFSLYLSASLQTAACRISPGIGECTEHIPDCDRFQGDSVHGKDSHDLSQLT